MSHEESIAKRWGERSFSCPDWPDEKERPEVVLCDRCGWPHDSLVKRGEVCDDCRRIEDEANTCEWCGDIGATPESIEKYGACEECANQGIDYEPIND